MKLSSDSFKSSPTPADKSAMDPNTALEAMRALAKEIHEDIHYEDERLDEWADAFTSLDEWLSKGGALPEDWAR